MAGDPSPTSGGNMLRMVGDPLAMEDGSRCSLLGDPSPTSGGDMLRMVGDPGITIRDLG